MLRGGVLGLAEGKRGDVLFVVFGIPIVVFLHEGDVIDALQGVALHVPDAPFGDDALEGEAVEGGEDELFGSSVSRLVLGIFTRLGARFDLIVGVLPFHDFPTAEGIRPRGIVVIGAVLFEL